MSVFSWKHNIITLSFSQSAPFSQPHSTCTGHYQNQLSTLSSYERKAWITSSIAPSVNIQTESLNIPSFSASANTCGTYTAEQLNTITRAPCCLRFRRFLETFTSSLSALTEKCSLLRISHPSATALSLKSSKEFKPGIRGFRISNILGEWN